MLNNAQVKEIFDREAILIGTSDGVPYYRAVELFGQAAADFALRHSMGKGGGNVYGIGDDYLLAYFVLKGIQIAATYANIAEIRDSGVNGRVCSKLGEEETDE